MRISDWSSDVCSSDLTPAGIAEARAYVARRFPGLANAPLLGGRVCQYENRSNGDYLSDRFPGQEGVWIIGGGSGQEADGRSVGKECVRKGRTRVSRVE